MRRYDHHLNDPYAFRVEDIFSLQLLLRAGDPSRPGWAAPHGVHDNWAKVFRGVHSGLLHLRNLYEFDAEKFMATLDTAGENIAEVSALVQSASRAGRGKIFQYGQALAGSFFADIGRGQFVKPDVHVVEIAAATLGCTAISAEQAVCVVQQSALHAGVVPRAVDKLMYLAGSSNFYLYGGRLREAEPVKRRFRLWIANQCGGAESMNNLAEKLQLYHRVE